MKMNCQLVFLAMLALLALTGTGFAAPDANPGPGLGAGIGAGLTILGAGLGISLIASRTVESMARQPEVAGKVQGAMIVSAALIEGATFFSLIVCILILVLRGG